MCAGQNILLIERCYVW